MFRPGLREIPRREALRYLAFRGDKVPPELEEALTRGEEALRAVVRPGVVYRLLPLREGKLEGCVFQPEGTDCAELLSGCTQAVLLAVTLGAGVDSLLLRLETRDMAQAVVVDALASAAVEAVCDDWEDELRAELRSRGFSLTDRFSPGYGDMPLSQQRELCTVLDAQRRIGLTVSASGMLLPRKSVTALLGISEHPKPRRDRDCRRCCLAQRCPYRKEGKTCGI